MRERDLILTDWLGVDYAVGSTVLYCEAYGNKGSRMVIGKVIEITEKGTPIIEVDAVSRGSRDKNRRRACRVLENVTVLNT